MTFLPTITATLETDFGDGGKLYRLSVSINGIDAGYYQAIRNANGSVSVLQKPLADQRDWRFSALNDLTMIADMAPDEIDAATKSAIQAV